MRLNSLKAAGAANIGIDQLVQRAYVRPIDTYTKLLIQAEGQDKGTTFTDLSGKTVTNTEQYDPVRAHTKLMLHLNNNVTDSATAKSVTNNNVTFSSSVLRFGTHSAVFNGTNATLTLADSADWNFGSGDFTIDCWINFTDYTNPNGAGFFAQYDSSTHYQQFFYSGGYLYWQSKTSGTATEVSSAWTPSNGVWYHLAVTRASGVMYLFINGVSQTLATNTNPSGTLPDVTSIVRLGDLWTTGWGYLKGYMDEMRVSKGVARWTANFTPYRSAYGLAATVQGDKKFGISSAEFKGSGEKLSMADSADFTFGADVFTVDCWIKITSLANDYQPVFCQGSGGQLLEVQIRSNGSLRLLADAIDTTSSAGVVSAGTWYHLAVIRGWGGNPNSWALTINGTNVNGTTSSQTLTDKTGTFDVGFDTANSGISFDGLIDEFRVSKGIARWTTTFTPPTLSYADAPQTEIGIYRDTVELGNYTKLLLHCDGTNGSTSIVDETGKAVTVVGTAQISTAQSKFGGASLLLDGNSDYLTLANSSDWNLFANNTDIYTLEWWVKHNDYTTAQRYFAHYDNNSNNWNIAIDTGIIYVQCVSGGSAILNINTGTVISDNSWHHIAVTVIGNGTGKIVKAYVDGVEKVSGGTTSNATFSGVLSIGDVNGGNFVNGYMDEIRLSKGISRWVENFTPPTSAYTMNRLQGDTDLLYSIRSRVVNSYNGSVVFWARPNGDSGTNYGHQQLTGVNATAGASRSTSINGFPYIGTTAVLNEVSQSCMTIYGKKGTVRVAVLDMAERISGTTVTGMYLDGTVWNNTTSDMNNIVILGDQSLAIGLGSLFELYARRATA